MGNQCNFLTAGDSHIYWNLKTFSEALGTFLSPNPPISKVNALTKVKEMLAASF